MREHRDWKWGHIFFWAQAAAQDHPASRLIWGIVDMTEERPAKRTCTWWHMAVIAGAVERPARAEPAVGRVTGPGTPWLAGSWARHYIGITI